jgi:hypothetical protein
MKLAQEFIILPLRFDVERLKAEVKALPPSAWRPHPTGFKGNSAVPLISVEGGLNDYFAGPMKGTRWLQQSPYIRQVLASFKVVFGRSRLMCLDGGAEVAPHCDANYHWFTRARIHIPVITFPEVEFNCHDKMIHMEEGDAWIFDSWKMHWVTNRSPHKRIHLVADTLGSSAFWAMVERSMSIEKKGGKLDKRFVDFDPRQNPEVLAERFNTPEVMPPSEVEELSEDLLEDLNTAKRNNPEAQVQLFNSFVRSFCQDWKMLWALYGTDEDGRDEYEKLRDRLQQQLDGIKQPLIVGSNGQPAQKVMFARILVACVRRPMPGVRTLQFAH